MISLNKLVWLEWFIAIIVFRTLSTLTSVTECGLKALNIRHSRRIISKQYCFYITQWRLYIYNAHLYLPKHLYVFVFNIFCAYVISCPRRTFLLQIFDAVKYKFQNSLNLSAYLLCLIPFYSLQSYLLKVIVTIWTFC